MKPIYQDSHFLIVEKPARIGVASDSSNDPTFLDAVRAYYENERKASGNQSKGYCVPIHFLDRPVSGVMVFATSSKAAERINKQFRNRTVEKTYLAVVEGRPKQPSMNLVDELLKNERENKTYIVERPVDGSKRSELSFKVIRQNEKYSLLEVKPKTGRSHQIRAQLSNQGMPIVGDRKYGSKFDWHNRIALHACSLAFLHPISKQKSEFKKSPPKIFEELI